MKQFTIITLALLLGASNGFAAQTRRWVSDTANDLTPSAQR